VCGVLQKTSGTRIQTISNVANTVLVGCETGRHMDIPAITKARSEVIEDFIQIETLLSQIIADYYLGRGNPVAFLFVLEVLYDEHCTFALKRNVLNKIIDAIFQDQNERKKADKEFQKLYRLNRIRNLFAHCGPDLYVAREGKGLRVTPDPRNPSEPLEFGKEYEEFKKLQPEVFVWLSELLPKLETARDAGVRRFWDRFRGSLPPTHSS